MKMDILKTMSMLISLGLFDKFMSDYVHGIFSCEIWDYEDISITQFEITINTGNKADIDNGTIIEWDIDTDKVSVNGTEYTDNIATNHVLPYVWGYMDKVVKSCIEPDTTDSFGMYFLNYEKFNKTEN